MNKVFIATFFLMIFFEFFSQTVQVGVANGNLPNINNFMIDPVGLDLRGSLPMYGTIKGFLIPRINLANIYDTNTIQNPATGLLIYNKFQSNNSTNAVHKGVYYFNGSKWVPIGEQNNWLVDGNDNVSINNFLGTINNVDLVFTVSNGGSNPMAGFIGETNTSYGRSCFGNYYTSFNMLSLSYNDAIPSGQYNCAFGRESLSHNSSGSRNVGFGGGSLRMNLSGNDNIAIGDECASMCVGDRNICIGLAAMYNKTGIENILIGNDAFSWGGSGKNNIVIGASSMSHGYVYANNISSEANNFFGNIGIGEKSMKYLNGSILNSNIKDNIGIGSNAMGYINRGIGNLSIGYYSGGGAAQYSSTFNIAENTYLGTGQDIYSKTDSLTLIGNCLNYLNSLQPYILWNDLKDISATSAVFVGQNLHVGTTFLNENRRLNIANSIYGCSGKLRFGQVSSLNCSVTPKVCLEINGNDGMLIPAGETTERPILPVKGTIRYNKTLKKVEGFDGIQWQIFN